VVASFGADGAGSLGEVPTAGFVSFPGRWVSLFNGLFSVFKGFTSGVVALPSVFKGRSMGATGLLSVLSGLISPL